MATPLSSAKAGPLDGRITVPGDKSISHRALLLGAMATGVTRISGLLEAEDVLNTAKVVAAMGAGVMREGRLWAVRGLGTGGLLQPEGELDFGNSGTGCRLTMGVVAGHPVEATFTGDASLSRRPMGRVLTPLKLMGLEVTRGADTLPLTLRGPDRPVPIVYESPVPSAQVKSAVLLAGLNAPGRTTVVEREATRDHTERMFRHFGAEVEVTPQGKGQAITVTGEAELTGRDVEVPADPSSAAFPAAAALIAEGSKVTVANVLINPTRAGFYQTLREMGADVAFHAERERNGEPLADITVKSGRLKGVTVPAERAPSMIDEYPVLAA
ncbi:MAG: 3-phosphoshikimate 1-carboxyvinyltransferase, partial [Hyphomicrobiales bacterium]